MRAKYINEEFKEDGQINESLGFEENMDPYKAIGVGQYNIPQIKNLIDQNPFIKKFFDEYTKSFKLFLKTNSVNPMDLAEFIDDYWNEITNSSNSEKDGEQFFPSEVDEFTNELLEDPSEFDTAWANVREGAGDYCEDCEEDLDDCECG